MGTFAAPLLIGSAVVGTGAAVAQGLDARRQAKISNNLRARQLKDDALARSNDRKRKLLTVLANQNVAAGAGGFRVNQGSARRIQELTFREYRRDQVRSDANTRRALDAGDRQTSAFRRATLINTVINAGQGVRAISDAAGP